MRIMFRGKRVDNGDWVYGFLYADGEKSYILRRTITDKPSMIEVISETVGQYTGLKDKNRERIFDGDIIKYDFGNIGTVYWETDSYWIGKNGQITNEDYVLRAFYSDCVVIGNAYDNPELVS